jgi:hypothetical protein
MPEDHIPDTSDNPIETATAGEAPGLQWKWVWITLAMFVVLYFLPILAASTVKGGIAAMIIGGWSFGGILVITALAGYLSKGVTIWEPALAGGLLTIMWYLGLQVVTPIKLDVIQLAVVLVAIFGLSLLGAGLGEGIQNAAKKLKETPEEIH